MRLPQLVALPSEMYFYKVFAALEISLLLLSRNMLSAVTSRITRKYSVKVSGPGSDQLGQARADLTPVKA